MRAVLAVLLLVCACRTAPACEPRTPEKLAALLAAYDARPDPVLLPEIDAAAAQHDAVFSRLYWYTDLTSAQIAASTQHKPILYLRLLGNLTDELSCANSRFFRTVLYANREVSAYLREHYVLVWESERPVPVITIDFGDGRTIKTTITGNSIHYILDANARVVDVIPGLVRPTTFLDILRAAEQPARTSTIQSRRAYRDLQLGALLSARDRAGIPFDLANAPPPTQPVPLGDELREEPNLFTLPAPALRAAPGAPIARADARAAGNLAQSKAGPELPMLRAISPPAPASPADLRSSPQWSTLVHELSTPDPLDAGSIALMREQLHADADRDGFDRTADSFRASIAEDTAFNTYVLRAQVLTWLVAPVREPSLASLNRRIYDDLFLTPATDPWLGLVPPDTYTALPTPRP
jgi:hypothetical protein